MKPVTNRFFKAVFFAAALMITTPAFAGDKDSSGNEETSSGFGAAYFSDAGHPAFSDPPQEALMAYDEMLDPQALDNIEPAAGEESTDAETAADSAEAPSSKSSAPVEEALPTE